MPSLAAWTGPFGAVLSQTAVDALEAGRVVVLPDLAFPMQADEATLMTPDLPEGRRKNISFDPVTGRVSGSPVHAEQTARTLRRFAADADRLLRSLLVPYADSLSLGRTSFVQPRSPVGPTHQGTTTGGCMSMPFRRSRCGASGSCGCSATGPRPDGRVNGGSASGSRTSQPGFSAPCRRRPRPAPGFVPCLG